MPINTTDYFSREEMVNCVRELVRYPSPQTEMFEAEPAILGLIDEKIIPLLSRLELPFRKDDMGNVIVEIGPGNADKSILLMAYAMTHPASSMSTPYAAELLQTQDGEAVRGRGISEQKGSLVAALAATYAAHQKGDLNGQLVLTISTAGETGRHDAAVSIVEALGKIPTFGVVVIGTSGRVALGNKGRIDVLATIRGKASHSSTPWLGLDAIGCAKEVISCLAALDLGTARHPELGEATLTPTAIRSFPEATHTVQNEVRMVYDRRLLPGQDPDEAMTLIEKALTDFQPCKVETRQGAFMYPSEIPSNGPLVTKIMEGYRLADLAKPDLFYSHGCLDAGFLNVKGCECTMWGPGSMDQWHSDNEMILVDDMVNGANAYLGFVQAALGSRER